MNQNKITSGTKLGGRDFINLSIFTVIFIVLFMACIMVMSMTIYTFDYLGIYPYRETLGFQVFMHSPL